MASASAWNPGPWQGEIISSYVYNDADRFTDRDGETQPLPLYSKHISQTYATLGLTDKVALIGTLDFQDTRIGRPGFDLSYSGVSTLTAGLQYQLTRRDGHATAVSVSYIDAVELPPQLLTLDGREPNVEVRGSWGESRTFRGRNVFGEVQLAGRYRTAGEFGGVQSQLTVGGDPTSRTLVLAKLRYTMIAAGEYEGFDLSRQTSWQSEISGVYRWRERDWIELGYVATLAGENALLETGWKIGFWRKF